MIKLHYVAQIELIDVIEQDDCVPSIDEIKKNIAAGIVEEEIKNILAMKCDRPNINIKRLIADVYVTD